MTLLGKRMSLDAAIFLGLVLGVATGLFFGESVGSLALIGDIYIGFLQMTVLPYITFSLIANIGGLPQGMSGKLARGGIIFLALSWAASLLAVVLFPLILPPLQSASFFSTGILEKAPELDFVNLFVPTNFFNSLANNIVPAVVVFCICLGAAMMTLPDRERIVNALNQLTEALGLVNSFLVRLAPIGVFAITASTAGTMQLEEFQRLQVYLLIYTLGALLMGLVILPGFLCSLTPFTWGPIMRAVRVPVITAFATGKVFIVLPLLIDQIENMFEENGSGDGKDVGFLKALVPMAYSFPHAGKLLALMFIPFTAWFVDQPLEVMDYPGFLGTGLLSFFGSPMAAMPFLLDLHKLPADMFHLFVVSGIYASRLGDALGALHIFVVSVLTTAFARGWLQMNKRKLVGFGIFSMSVWLVVLVATRGLLSQNITHNYERDNLITGMHSAVLGSRGVVNQVALEPDPELKGMSVLERLEKTGTLRVGYVGGNLPFSFFNEKGELVGLDVDAAYGLAEDLGVSLEFVPANWKAAPEELADGLYDVLMSGTIILPSQLALMSYTDPYMIITAGVIVPDHRRAEIATRIEEGNYHGLRFGVPMNSSEMGFFNRIMPGSELVQSDSLEQFFRSGGRDLDGYLWAVETGAAWTLVYPAFSVVPILPHQKVPVVYAVARDQEGFLHVLNGWMQLFNTSGRKDRLYDYWILGKGTEERGRRWSIIRDVLGWVD